MIPSVRARAVVLGFVVAAACGNDKREAAPSPAPTGSGDTRQVQQALAEIVATTSDVVGTVEVRRKGSATWERVAVGATLRERDWIRATKGSFARVRIGDRGFVELREDTTIIVDTAIRVETGTLTGQAEPGKAPLVVRAEDGSETRIAAAEGGTATQFRVTPRRDKGVEIAVTGGAATLSTSNGETSLSEGQATEISENKAGEVVQLIAFPRSLTPGIDARFQFVSGKAITLAWSVVKGASGYHLQIARDVDFRELVQSSDLRETTASFTPDRPGLYAWRVAARDSSERLGEYGFARRVYAEQDPPRDLLLAPVDGAKVGFSDSYPRIEFSWQSPGEAAEYKLVIGKGKEPTTDTVTTVPTSEQKVEIGSLREGTYHWGVYAIRDGVEVPIFIAPRLLTIRRQRVKALTEKLWDDDAR